MAIGDDATAAGMALVASTADRRKGYEEINKTRDYIALKAVLKSAVTTVGNALLGAASALAGRTALGIDLGSPDLASLRVHVPQYNAAGQLTSQDPTLAGHVVNKQTLDAAIGGVASPTTGTSLTLSGHLYTPNNIAGGAGTIAYIQTSDGRLTRGVSARKYKKLIRKLTAAALGDLFPQLVDYEMKNEFDPSNYRFVGYIADDMVGTPLERFVTFGEDGDVEGFDVLQLLIAQVAQLRGEILELKERDA